MGWLVIACMGSIGCAEDAPDWEEKAYDCKDEGGTCTVQASILCSSGTQPITADDPNLTDCGGGHCCIPEETESTCSSEENYVCIPGNKCSHPWRSVEGSLTCNEGRVCCAYRP